jgi:general secretion pathway protein C
MGDDIDDRASILSVEPRRVVFVNHQSRRKEFVEIPEDPSLKITAAPRKAAPTGGIDKVDDNKYVVKRAEIDAQMANFNTLLTQARAVPDMCGGQMVGFKLTQIQPNSFYSKIGLKENCTIRSVNGEKMTDAAKALSLLQDLKHMNSLDLGVVCGGCDGKESDINYDIQ